MRIPPVKMFATFHASKSAKKEGMPYQEFVTLMAKFIGDYHKENGRLPTTGQAWNSTNYLLEKDGDNRHILLPHINKYLTDSNSNKGEAFKAAMEIYNSQKDG